MAETIKLGLLGHGIGHSRAKSLHELMGEIHGLKISYLPMDLAGKIGVVIRDELIRCRDEGFTGVNVTHPYKRDAFYCVETLAGFPHGLTSINTVMFRSNRLLADNTDFSGLSRAFAVHFGTASKPGRVLMLGTGGVGLAIAFALYRLGVSELVVYDTNFELAENTTKELRGYGLPIRMAAADLVEEMQAAEGLVNATPVGMFQYPGLPFPAAGFGRQRWAFDAVYTPENTAFLECCRRHGIGTISGFRLFLYQGIEAFERFTGIEVDAAAVEQIYLQRYPLPGADAYPGANDG